MGGAQSKGPNFKWIDKYELIDIDDNDHLLKIMSRVGESEYLGKEISCHSEAKIYQMENMIDKKILQPCPYLMKLVRVGLKKERARCEESKIFCMVFEKPYKTLKEDSIFKKFNNQPYNAEDILCILQSVVRALYYLREMNQYHTKISASNIYINEDQTVVLGDPWLLSQQNDFNETMHGIIYPSPEKILYKNGYINQPDHFLSDLFSLGITLLQMYFLEHMDVIYEKGYRRIIETRLIQHISNINSPELKKKMKIILSHQPQKRSHILKEYSLVDSRAETFINSQKQMFKKQYIKNMLITSEVKTVKMSRRDYNDRDRMTYTDRDQSDSDDTISGNRNVQLVHMNSEQVREATQHMKRPQVQRIVYPEPMRRQYNYIMPVQIYTETPQKIIPNILNRESESKTLFTFNKKSRQIEQNDDNKSISSIEKQDSSFSKDYFQVDFFENNGKPTDQVKMRNDRRSQTSKKEGSIIEPLNTAAVNTRMTEERNMKKTLSYKNMKRKSEPVSQK